MTAASPGSTSLSEQLALIQGGKSIRQDGTPVLPICHDGTEDHVPETGSTEEFAVIEREQTSTSSEATAPVAKSRKAPARDAARRRPEPRSTPTPKVEAPASDMTALVHSLSEFAAETGRADLAQRLEQRTRGCSIPTCG